MSRLPAVYDGLPPQTEIADEAANDVIAARTRAGQLAAIAPKSVLRTPMWIHPLTASKIGPTMAASVYWREYSDLVDGQPGQRTRVEVSNPLHPVDAESSPHGALRYVDLDALMALGLAWTRSQSAEIEIMQRQVFDWMGYSHFVREPYEELRASLERMQHTSIAIQRAGQDIATVRPFRLLDSATLIEAGGRGSPKIIQARMSSIWADALRSGGWQAVDLIPYAKLVREHRRIGLARVLYLYLASWRNENMEFNVPLWSIRERFAQARPSGKLKYNNPFAPGSQLVRALRTLHESGVIRLDQLPTSITHTHKLKGEFLPVGAPDGGIRQQWIIAPGILGAPPRALPAPVKDEGEKPSDNKNDGAGGIGKHLKTLQKIVKVNTKLLRQASGRGWDHDALARVLLAALWEQKHDRLVKAPGAWAAAIISGDEGWTREKFSQEYPIRAIAEWAMASGGPLNEEVKS